MALGVRDPYALHTPGHRPFFPRGSAWILGSGAGKQQQKQVRLHPSESPFLAGRQQWPDKLPPGEGSRGGEGVGSPACVPWRAGGSLGSGWWCVYNVRLERRPGGLGAGFRGFKFQKKPLLWPVQPSMSLLCQAAGAQHLCSRAAHRRETKAPRKPCETSGGDAFCLLLLCVTSSHRAGQLTGAAFPGPFRVPSRAFVSPPDIQQTASSSEPSRYDEQTPS